MKITIGKDTNRPEDFRIYDDEGNDITKKLSVKRISFDIKACEMTTVTMEVYVSELSVETATIGYGKDYATLAEWEAAVAARAKC